MNFTTTIACGRIGKHAPSIKTAGRATYAGFSLAVNHGYGEHKTTSWYHVRLWGKAGDAFAKYATPGQTVLVEGEFRCDQWDDKQTGQKKEQWILHCWKGELGEKPRARQGGGGGASHAPRSTDDYGTTQATDPLIDDTPF